MNEFTMSELIGLIIDIWEAFMKGILCVILFFTGPLWIIPYAIYNKLTYGVWF